MNKKSFAFLLCIFTTIYLFAQTPCRLDSAFGSNGKIVDDFEKMGVELKVLNNNEIIIAMNHTGGNSDAFLKKYSSTGKIDSTFGINGICKVSAQSINTNIASMKYYDNKLFVSGNTTSTNGNNTIIYPYLAAFDLTGNAIQSFGNNGYITFPSLNTCNDMIVDSNGNIFICGNKLTTIGTQNTTIQYLLKLKSNYTIDSTFGQNGITWIIPPGSNYYYILEHIMIDHSNNILLCGHDYYSNGKTSVLVAKVKSNGLIDSTFSNNGIGIYKHFSSDYQNGVKILEDNNNEYIIFGNISVTDQDCFILKVDSLGIIITNFLSNGWGVVDLLNNHNVDAIQNAKMLPDGRLLICGSNYNHLTSEGYSTLYCMFPNGNPDTIFAPNGVYLTAFNNNNNSSALSLDIETTGKIVVSGFSRTCSGGVCGPHYLSVSKYLNSFTSVNINEQQSNTKTTNIFPNPSSDNISIEFSEPMKELSVLDFSGRVIQTINLNNQNFINLNIQQLSQGFYFIKSISIQGQSQCLKFYKLN